MEKIKELLEKYGKDLKTKLNEPIFFINEIIGFNMEPFALTPYQEEWLNLVHKNDRINIMAFRSSGKTEAFLVDYPIFKAFTTPGWQGILVSNSLPQSVEIVRRIREKVVSSEILRTSIPDSKGASWSKTEIELKNGARIMSKPGNVNLAGYHVDYVGGDEIGYWTDMNIITKTLPPIVTAKQGKIVFIGTPTSEIDPIHQLMKNQAYISKAYPANMKDSGGKTLWSMRYPTMSMSKKRAEYDSISWSREFLCKPLSAGDRIFPFELISKGFDFDSPFRLSALTHKTYYMGLDFALSGAAGADFTVFTVLEKDGEVCRLINMERYKGLSYQAQKARIKQLHDIYKPIKVIADEGSFGKSFVQDLQSDHVNIEGFRFSNESKQNLITNLRNFFEQSRLIINKDKMDSRTNEVTDFLVRELQKFGVVYDIQKKTARFEGLGEHDDMVISLSLAAWGARGFGSMTYSVQRGNKPSSSIIYLGKVN